MRSSSFSSRTIITAILIAVCALLIVLLMNQLSEKKAMQAANRELMEKIQRLEQTNQATPIAEPMTATPASTAAIEPPATIPEPAPPPEPQPKLVLQETTVNTVPDGLQATLVFTPDMNKPMGEVFMVIRIPGGGRILGMQLKTPETYENLGGRVSEDGKFAAFRAKADVLSKAEVIITVSEPAVLDLRGTCGVGPFDLFIDTDQAKAVPK